MKPLMKWPLGALILGLLGIADGVSAASPGPGQSRVFAVIVANNHSLDADTESLRFADDDGAKYFEMLRAAGADTTLLAVLDPDAQARFPEAAAAATPPYRDALLTRIRDVFKTIEAENENGIETHFAFIYSGHGNVGANREGYINLTDAKFGRSDLFREILAKSPATYNHIILDACHAYYLVNKKGEKDRHGDYTNALRRFLSAEELKRYPNTGVILAASSESETHEWSKWESGIFSHELRSALLGSADINGDNKVTYAEAASCVEAANSAIEIPKARLKVFYQPPAADVDLPMMDLRAFTRNQVPKIVFPKEMAGRYHVEDARGVRLADFNYSAEQGISVALPGSAPFFIRTDSEESSIEDVSATPEILVADLSFEQRAAADKGSFELSFRKALYTTPFGMGFFKGTQAVLPALPPQASPEITLSDSADNKGRRTGRTLGCISLGAGVAAGIGSGVAYALASQSYDQYRDAETADEARPRQEETENRLLTSRVLLGVGATLAVTGTTLLVVDLVKMRRKCKSERQATPIVASDRNGFALGIQGRF